MNEDLPTTAAYEGWLRTQPEWRYWHDDEESTVVVPKHLADALRDELLERIDMLTTERDCLTVDRDELLAEVERLRHDCLNAEADRDDMSKAVDNLRDKWAAAEARVAELEADYADVAAAASSALEELEDEREERKHAESIILGTHDDEHPGYAELFTEVKRLRWIAKMLWERSYWGWPFEQTMKHLARRYADAHPDVEVFDWTCPRCGLRHPSTEPHCPCEIAHPDAQEG